jgi:hypothetical protein
MPSRIPISLEVVYLRTLADTGNPTLVARHAGLSRDWAYKRCAITGFFRLFDQPATSYPRSCRQLPRASLMARSFLARFIFDIPQAPPMIAKGRRTMVEAAAAAPA